MQNVKPLLGFASPRDIPEVLNGLDTIECDKLVLKYTHTNRTYKIFRNFFLDHPEYTHLIIHPDDLVVDNTHFQVMKQCAGQFPVLSGVCDCTVVDPRIAIDIVQMPNPDRNERRYVFTMPRFIHDKLFIRVWWAGFPFTWIERWVLEKIKFEDDTRFNPTAAPNQGWATDLMFHYNCLMNCIPVYANTKVFMRHLKHHRKLQGFIIQTGIKEPKTYFNGEDITQESYEKYLSPEDLKPMIYRNPSTGQTQMI